ncbi:MAG: hypothetical protein QF531_01170 [Candidatus Poseidonia sp.]|nr:hypothetical protein [Poseidonia sp.]
MLMTAFTSERWTGFSEAPTGHLHMSLTSIAHSTWTNSLAFRSRSGPRFSVNNATTEEEGVMNGLNDASITTGGMVEATTVAAADTTTTEGVVETTAPVADTTTTEGVVETTAPVADLTTSVPGISDNSTTTGHAQNATIPISLSAMYAIDVKLPGQEAVDAKVNNETTAAVDSADQTRTMALVTVERAAMKTAEMEGVTTETKAVAAVARNAATTTEHIAKHEGNAQVTHTTNHRVTFAPPGNLNERTIER